MGRFRQSAIPMETQVEQHSNHTTVAYVIVSFPDGQRLFTGVAKRCPEDKHDPEVGASLALGRAMQAASKFLVRQGNGLVKHHDDMRLRNKEREKRGKKAVAENLKKATSSFSAAPVAKIGATSSR